MICNFCPEPKPILTDDDFYPNNTTKCINCLKKYQKEYRERKKLLPAAEKKEKDTSLIRICKECPPEKNQKIDADFYSPVSHQCKKCIVRLRKEKRAKDRTILKQVPIFKDQRISDLEEQIRLLNLLRDNEARQASTANRQ